MRFCSRCGFQLTGIAILLENEGSLPQLQSEPEQTSKRRTTMIRESVYLTLAVWALALVATAMWDFGGPFETIAKVASLIFFVLGLVGLLRFTYAFVFVKDDPLPSRKFVLPEPNRAALPPQQSMPISDFPRRSQTKEISPQPSVTENTTRLLSDQPNNPVD
ncbi:MAG: hypothetical protein ACREBG_21600 [Pyrinomonadaceae bacterium]